MEDLFPTSAETSNDINKDLKDLQKNVEKPFGPGPQVNLPGIPIFDSPPSDWFDEPKSSDPQFGMPVKPVLPIKRNFPKA